MVADGSQGGGNGVSRGSSEDDGRGDGGNIGTDSFGNNRGRRRQGQITINQKAAEMAVEAAAMVATAAAVAEVKTMAEEQWGHWRQQLWQQRGQATAGANNNQPNIGRMEIVVAAMVAAMTVATATTMTVATAAAETKAVAAAATAVPTLA
jgi:hypothetical protein